MSLLEVKDLSVAFGARRVVDQVSFSLDRGETLALVGESGSGKSLTALSLLQLLPRGGTNPTGTIRLDDDEMIGASPDILHQARGDVAGIVFQEPMTSLNPLHRIGRQVAEAITLHRQLPRALLRRRVIGVLEEAGFPDAAGRLDAFPHQLSGGQRQRVMIAMALANDPALLIADEPTTALDVTVQAQILELIEDLQAERDMGVVLITHDLGVVADVADNVVVMYAGHVVERSSTAEALEYPVHPYTEGLLGSMPSADLKGQELPTIPGTPPSLRAIPSGCAFRTRCPIAIEECAHDVPPLLTVAPGRDAACIRRTTISAKEAV
jgi:oligopeptide transport system ATP-binding protein